MQAALTNTGHRRALSLLHPQGGVTVARALEDPLVRLCASFLAPWDDGPEQRALLARGWIERVPDATEKKAIAHRMRRNPIENLCQAVIEYTTHCNFSCKHCYNAGVERTTETDLNALSAATDTLSDIGVRQFAFIGGEVSKHGDGWLDLARRLRDRGATTVGLLSNGWFLGQERFVAGGITYADDTAYLAELARHGVTHMSFSLDGRGREHDESRGNPGLYARILAAFPRVSEAGLLPRVSLLWRDGVDLEKHLKELAPLLYGEGHGPSSIMFDPTNIISNHVEMGNGAIRKKSSVRIADVKEGKLRCAGFYRPAPHITLKSNGQLATCRIADAGEGYGNFHERPLAGILNGLQENFVWKLHAERRIGDYVRFVDTGIFGTRVSGLCTLRAIVTSIARRMHERGTDPADTGGIAKINLEVAKSMRYIA